MLLLLLLFTMDYSWGMGITPLFVVKMDRPHQLTMRSVDLGKEMAVERGEERGEGQLVENWEVRS